MRIRSTMAMVVVWAAGLAGVTARATAADNPARLLVVTVTTGFRHGSIATAEPVLEELGRSSGLFHVDFLRMPPPPPPAPAPIRKRPEGMSDEDWKQVEEAYAAEVEKFRVANEAARVSIKDLFAKAFAPESLAQFDGMIFASTTGELPIPDLAGFLNWIKSGKAFIGLHAASDTLKSSDAYCEMIGGHFAGHPWNAGGEHAFVVHEPAHRLSAMFGERFRWKDEIYQYDLRYKPENLRVLVSIDMAASNPKEPWHVPVSWVREYGKGRVFYTNFGHNDATWKEPRFQKHMTEGMAWALGRFDAPADPNPDAQAAEYLRSVLAVAVSTTGGNADDLRAKADARIAKDPAWATGLRPMLLEIRSLPGPKRAEAYAKLVAAIEAP